MTERNTTPDPRRSRKPKVARETPEIDGSNVHRKPNEHGGPRGLEPTRYGDWERNGRCVDF